MKNNMYKNVTPFNPLAGKCGHECQYCSSHTLRERYKACAVKYDGPYRIIEKELNKNLGEGNTIFVCAQNDLFEKGVPEAMIRQVIRTVTHNPDNIYMFQTKNPARYMEVMDEITNPEIPWTIDFWLGTTIESNREDIVLSNAPSYRDRLTAMGYLPMEFKTYVTVEPIVDFDEDFAEFLCLYRPNKIYIGADSKRHNLPEPSKEKTLELIRQLHQYGMNIELKSNLARIIGEENMGNGQKSATLFDNFR